MSRRRRKPPPTVAHYGAPVAFLAAVTIAVVLVHSGLNHSGNEPTGPVTTVQQPTTTASTTHKAKPHAKHVFAVVQTGDTFGSIAAREGISVEQLQTLNPGVSSNALQVGQKLRVK